MKLVEQFHFEPSLIEEIEVFSPPSKYFQDNITDLSTEETQILVNLLNKYYLKSKLREESLEYMQYQYEVAQRKYVDLFYFSPTGYFILDPDGQILESNLTATNLLGYPNSAIIGKQIDNFLSPKEGKILKSHIQTLLNGERKAICELKLINKNQLQKEVLMECILWPDEMGDLTQIRTAVIDISEKKNLENKVAQQAKMDAVDSLVGSIAHDFNNILHSIISNTEYLVHGESHSEDVDNHLKRILDLSSRAADSISQLLDIGSHSTSSQKYIKGQTFIQQIKPALEKFIPDSIEIEWRLQDEDSSVNIDVEQIQIILINLLLNSVKAMAESGTITIDLYKHQPARIPAFPFPDLETKEWLILRVTDNGRGIKPERMKTLFDPDFTFDKYGNKKGLNLLRARGIMNQHEGHIHVESTEHVGTSVSLLFPTFTLEQPDYNTSPPADNNELVDGNGRTLLLVEDEIEVAQSFTDILEFLGFEVLVGSNGVDGLAMFEKYHERIDVVITDLLMPEMDGETFLKTVRKTDTDVKIIVASGNPISKKVNELYEWDITGFVQKPFTINTISSVLKNALVT